MLGVAASLTFCVMIGCGDLGEGCRGGGVGVDFDDDGVADSVDNCPEVANPDQADADGDGFGDVCDSRPDDPDIGQADSDGDGVDHATANCRDVSNPDQADADEDSIGNVCDPTPGAIPTNTGGGCSCGQSRAARAIDLLPLWLLTLLLTLLLIGLRRLALRRR